MSGPTNMNEDGLTLNGVMIDVPELTRAQRKQLAGPPLASPWDPYDRLFGDWQSGLVFDYGQADARALENMIDTDGTAAQLEQVLSLPIRGADWEITGKTKAADRVRDQLKTEQMDLLIAQSTSGGIYRKAFFETTWSLDGGETRIQEAAFRPASSCEAGYDPKTGRQAGFRQRIGNPGGLDPRAWYNTYRSPMPGYVHVPQQRSFIYTHGIHRQPKRGVSDLAVAWWAYETRRRTLFLLLEFLENQALPKVAFYGDSKAEAVANATAFANLRGAGTLGMKRGSDPTAKNTEVIESSGQGHAQFLATIQYLEQQMVDSVLAGFTKLAGAAASGTGSFALSADQSEFFTVARQGVADEIALQISTGLFAPICVYNLDDPADVPKLSLGPLSRQNTEKALALLQSIIVAPQLNVPSEFVDMLLMNVASLLGLDVEQLQAAVEQYAQQRAQDDALKREQSQAMAKQQIDAAKSGVAPGVVPGGAPVGGPGGKLATAAAIGEHLVKKAKSGVDPKDALAQVQQRKAA